MELIGPVAAQNKVDAMQCKTYVPLDPTEAPSGFSRGRSRSVGHKRGKTKGAAQTLLPLEQFPAATSAGMCVHVLTTHVIMTVLSQCQLHQQQEMMTFLLQAHQLDTLHLDYRCH